MLRSTLMIRTAVIDTLSTTHRFGIVLTVFEDNMNRVSYLLEAVHCQS